MLSVQISYGGINVGGVQAESGGYITYSLQAIESRGHSPYPPGLPTGGSGISPSLPGGAVSAKLLGMSSAMTLHLFDQRLSDTSGITNTCSHTIDDSVELCPDLNQVTRPVGDAAVSRGKKGTHHGERAMEGYGSQPSLTIRRRRNTNR